MTGQFFISLLNPGMGLLLSLAFWLLWLNQREQPYVALAAIGYALLGFGFLVQDVFPPLPNSVHLIASNLLFFLAAAGITAAVLGRYRIAVPYRLLGIMIAIGMAGHVWFLLVQHSISVRILIVGIMLGAITSVIVFKLVHVQKNGLMDRLLFWLSVVTSLNFVLRPMLILALAGGYETYDGFQQSLYWSTVQFTQVLISVSFALILMVAVAHDLIRELRTQAFTDQLSGLLNRRGFEVQAASALERSAAQGQQSALLIVDFDYFKQINDNFGHIVGDNVIALFGETIRRAAPERAVSGRIGGEEFALLLPDADAAAAQELAERVRTEMAALAKDRLPDGLIPTLSIGIGMQGADTKVHSLMADADSALYNAKQNGRDRVSFEPNTIEIADRSKTNERRKLRAS